MSKERTVYCYKFTDETVFITASTTNSISQEDLEKCNRIESGSTVAYFVKETIGDYQVVTYDEKFEYLIRCNDYENLMKILEGMRKLAK